MQRRQSKTPGQAEEAAQFVCGKGGHAWRLELQMPQFISEVAAFKIKVSVKSSMRTQKSTRGWLSERSELCQPFAQALLPQRSGFGSETRGIGAQLRDGELLDASDLDGMPDQPALEVFRGSFGMKLKRQHGLSVTECLILTNICGGEKGGSAGKIEGVAVPVQDGHAFEIPERALSSFRSEGERRPADLLGCSGIDASAQGAGKELGAEANTQRRTGKIEALLEDRDFIGEERILVVFVSADRPSQNNQQVGIGQLRGMQVAHPGIEVLNAKAASGENTLECAEVFEVNVSDGRSGLHGEATGL